MKIIKKINIAWKVAHDLREFLRIYKESNEINRELEKQFLDCRMYLNKVILKLEYIKNKL